jgi:hypothetical protein
MTHKLAILRLSFVHSLSFLLIIHVAMTANKSEHICCGESALADQNAKMKMLVGIFNSFIHQLSAFDSSLSRAVCVYLFYFAPIKANQTPRLWFALREEINHNLLMGLHSEQNEIRP